jgi:hypothetical protein
MKLTDTPSQNIMKHFGETSAFIREARRRGGSVFLHCVEGKSRSATCAIALMIDTEGMTLQDALSRVQGARPIVRPNEGFLIQLGHYEKIVRPGHVGNGGGGSVQLSKAQAGFRISVASPQPVQPPYPKAAQEHQNSAPQQGRRFHAGHAHPHQHTAQWTGHDRGMPSKASAPPQAQRPVNFGPHAYGVLPAPAQAADPQYAHQQQRMAVAYMSGGIPSPTYSAGNDDKWAQRDEKPWTPRGEANVVASAHNGAGWPGPGMEEHAPARGEALSAYSSYSGQQAPPRPRAMGYRSASASGSLPEADPSQHHQHLRHLGVNEVTDQASLHAAGFPDSPSLCIWKIALLSPTCCPHSLHQPVFPVLPALPRILHCCLDVARCMFACARSSKSIAFQRQPPRKRPAATIRTVYATGAELHSRSSVFVKSEQSALLACCKLLFDPIC